MRNAGTHRRKIPLAVGESDVPKRAFAAVGTPVAQVASMKKTIIAAILLTFAMPPAEAKVYSLRRSPRASLVRAEKHLARGEWIVKSTKKIKRVSKRIRVLMRSNGHFRRARALALNAVPHAEAACSKVPTSERKLCHKLQKVERRATRALVNVLNEEAEFYFGRTSTGHAKKLNEEALALLPKDRRARTLARDIRNAANSNGGVAVRVRR